MSDDPVLLAIDHAITTVTLNRPGEGNAIDLPLARALLSAAIRCDTDPNIRCVVLTGNGRLFCAGGDIGSIAAAGDGVAAFVSELAGILHMAVSRLMRMRKPLLVLANGPAAGAGYSLAIAGDIVIAATSAHFTPAYGAVGLSPDGGMSWLLPRLVGMRRAQDILLSNRRIGAADAAAIGLVTRVVDDTALAAEGSAQATLLAGAATQAIGATRALLLSSYGESLEGQLEQEARGIAVASAGREGREGVSAFLAKRKPEFDGLP